MLLEDTDVSSSSELYVSRVRLSSSSELVPAVEADTNLFFWANEAERGSSNKTDGMGGTLVLQQPSSPSFTTRALRGRLFMMVFLALPMGNSNPRILATCSMIFCSCFFFKDDRKDTFCKPTSERDLCCWWVFELDDRFGSLFFLCSAARVFGPKHKTHAARNGDRNTWQRLHLAAGHYER